MKVLRNTTPESSPRSTNFALTLSVFLPSFLLFRGAPAAGSTEPCVERHRSAIRSSFDDRFATNIVSLNSGRDADAGQFQIASILQLPSLFHPVRDTREKQVQLWKELILDFCKTQKIFVIGLEEEFPLFSNPVIERSLTHEAREAFLAAIVSEGRAEWLDKGHRKCLILWHRIQDWADIILNFVS
ncbi:hypothetical protein EUGRSUZ_E01319 [Eucalyptus grandis]|uniref:Uncharacterized protein n=2 Tax=Eucalyptus grandis TaxID=71139 RepID=A0ACC3KW78_EUCGR|nr:hypothetical protein EUGRSUZ_E01319 [Eucalyptus grandis]